MRVEISISNNKTMHYFRQEATEYLQNPVEGDSKRGLKRTWKATEKEAESPAKSKGNNLFKMYMTIYRYVTHL